VLHISIYQALFDIVRIDNHHPSEKVLVGMRRGWQPLLFFTGAFTVFSWWKLSEHLVNGMFERKNMSYIGSFLPMSGLH
jgi:hypothetical protein